MASIDLKKVHREHYSARSGDPAIVDVPSRKFLMIDGEGDPNTSRQYRDAVEAIYPLAYGLRAEVKRATGDSYVVMPLEGLWWAEDMSQFDVNDKSKWLWTAMILVPDAVTETMTAEVLSAVTAGKKLAAGDKARVRPYVEGESAQILHVGPYAEEAPTIARLHEFIEEQGFTRAGRHHEIYLSDPRKGDPAKLRTIIRQPFDRT